MQDRQPRLIMDVVKPVPATLVTSETKRSRKLFASLLRRVHVARRTARIAGTSCAVIALLVIALGSIHHQRTVSSLVPSSVKRQVSFTIYVPDSSRLPAGYRVDQNSFSSSNNAVVYKITYGLNSALVVTVQPLPSGEAIQGFYKAHMPLTISIQTGVGIAAVGVLNDETVVSLPTTTNSWVLITAPLNIDQAQLKQVVRAMTGAT